jgi:hypothetical protein
MGNAYDNASLLVTPNGYKASKIYSAKPTDGSGDLAFSRASTAMRRNSAGLWEEVANNVPRLQYPVGGGCPSWLFEPQATNIVLRSTDFSLVWTPSSATIAPTSIASPIDSVNWSRFTINNATGLDRISQNLTIAAGLTYTLSVFLKSDTFSGDVLLRGDANDNTANSSVNLTTGVITNSGANFISSRTYVEGNGRRLELTFTTTLNPTIDIATFNTGVSGVSFLVTQCQLEAGSVATSPIITAGSAVTRLLDSVGEQKTFLTGSAGITLFAHAKGVGIAGNTDRLIALGDNNSPANNFISISVNGSAKWGFSTFGLGTDVSEYSAIDTTIESKLAFVLTPTKASYFINGVKLGEDLGTFNPALLDYISLLALASRGGSFLLKQYNIEKAALSDSEAIELTTL